MTDSTVLAQKGFKKIGETIYYQNNIGVEWAWRRTNPSWLDLLLCWLGGHKTTRRAIVNGYVGYFTPIQHLWCACEKYHWTRWDGVIVNGPNLNSGSSFLWVMGWVSEFNPSTEEVFYNEILPQVSKIIK